MMCQSCYLMQSVTSVVKMKALGLLSNCRIDHSLQFVRFLLITQFYLFKFKNYGQIWHNVIMLLDLASRCNSWQSSWSMRRFIATMKEVTIRIVWIQGRENILRYPSRDSHQLPSALSYCHVVSQLLYHIVMSSIENSTLIMT